MRYFVLVACVITSLNAFAGEEASYVVKRGDTLSEISSAAYGSEHYARLLGVHLGIEPRLLPAGQTLDVPSLQAIVDAEQIARIDGAAQNLVSASLALRAVQPRLWTMTRDGGSLSKGDRRTLEDASDLARAASELLLKREAPPKAAAGQARAAASLLTRLVEGPDSYGYSITDAHRRLANALEYLVLDARAQEAAQAAQATRDSGEESAPGGKAARTESSP